MADDAIDHLAVAEEAERLNTLAVRRGAEGRRDEALTAAEEAAGLYRALAGNFPAMFGVDAERADALVTAIRDERAVDWAAVPTATGRRRPAGEPTTRGVSAPDTARAPHTPGVVATSGPEPPIPTDDHPGRWRRAVVSTTVVAVAVVAVLFGTVSVVGWPLSRSHMPAPVSAPAQMQPPPAPVPVRPWTATARTDVAPTGVTLRSAPSTTAAPVGRLAPDDEVRIQCGEVGQMISTEIGERSSSWLRTTAGSYLSAVNVEFRGPIPVRNCTPGQPAVPLPHHR